MQSNHIILALNGPHCRPLRLTSLEEADEDAAEGRAGSAPGKSVVHRAVGTLGGQDADEVEAHRADLTLTEGLEAAL